MSIIVMLGNFTFSLDGDWAASEYLRQGKLGRLIRLLRNPLQDDDRSFVRKLAAEALLPNFPEKTQLAIRSIFHANRFGTVPPSSPLRPAAAAAWRKDEATGSAFEKPNIARNQRDAIRMMWASADSGEDLDLGLERMHGIEFRDVSAYRPLIEFCHGLPVEQLRRDGRDRYLARRLAKGFMPDAQRLEQRHGRHNADWHARIMPRRDELAEQLRSIRSHSGLNELLDIDKLLALLGDWGEATPIRPEHQWPRHMALTRALTAAAFVSHAEKRNDFCPSRVLKHRLG